MGKKVKWRFSNASRRKEFLVGKIAWLIKDDTLESNEDSNLPELPNFLF